LTQEKENQRMSTAALIVAAGRGTRAGGSAPKQWQILAGRSVLAHAVARFKQHSCVDRVVLVLHPDDMDMVTGITCIAGGVDRAASVRNGLDALQGQGLHSVLIHDVARPCVSDAVIDAVIEALKTSVGAAPALAVTDALWTGEDGKVTGTQDRTGLFRAQTPQGFHFDAIVAAHAAHAGGAADDVEVARAAGLDVAIVTGCEDNLKITHPADFARAEQILRAHHGH
jgi:2-C-methyl-D-erythritol 4-phosphate cytidylyltransferase